MVRLYLLTNPLFSCPLIAFFSSILLEYCMRGCCHPSADDHSKEPQLEGDRSVLAIPTFLVTFVYLEYLQLYLFSVINTPTFRDNTLPISPKPVSSNRDRHTPKWPFENDSGRLSRRKRAAHRRAGQHLRLVQTQATILDEQISSTTSHMKYRNPSTRAGSTLNTKSDLRHTRSLMHSLRCAGSHRKHCLAL